MANNNRMRLKVQLLKVFAMKAEVKPDVYIKRGFAAVLFAIAFFLAVRAIAPNGFF